MSSGQGLRKVAYAARKLFEPDERDPAETVCEHGSVITFPNDPDWDLVGPSGGCEETAVELVYIPDVLGQRVALCPFHVARFADAEPAFVEQLVAKGELSLDTDGIPFVTIEDVPPRIRNGNLGRVGLDQSGLAHYHAVSREDGERVVLAVDGSLEVELGPVYRPIEATSVAEYVRYVAAHRGWAALDERYRPEGQR